MERKTNILQLVSMCLGAVLALSMVLSPANAAFAYNMPQQLSCQELEQSLPGFKEYWQKKCGPGVYVQNRDYCEEKKEYYTEKNPDIMQYLDKCLSGLSVDMEARAQSCEELAQTLPPYFKEDFRYKIEKELNDYCGPDVLYRGRECDRTKEYYKEEFPDVMKYIEYKCSDLEPRFPGEWEYQEDDVDVYPTPEIKSGEIKNGDSCKGEVSEDHGGDYTGMWRIVKDGGCGKPEVKICDRPERFSDGNVEKPVTVKTGICCYARWKTGQSYSGSISYDEASQTFGCDSY